MRLIRVFPRRTKATPNDALAYFGPPDRFAEADEVHVDCTFTYDKRTALSRWRRIVIRLRVTPEPRTKEANMRKPLPPKLNG